MMGPVMARVKVASFCTQSLAFGWFFHMFYCRQFSCLFLTFHLAPSRDIEILQGRPWNVDFPVKGKVAPGDSEFLPTLRYRANDPGPSSPPENTSPMIPAPTSPTLVTMLSKLQCMSIPTKVSTQCGCPTV